MFRRFIAGLIILGLLLSEAPGLLAFDWMHAADLEAFGRQLSASDRAELMPWIAANRDRLTAADYQRLAAALRRREEGHSLHWGDTVSGLLLAGSSLTAIVKPDYIMKILGKAVTTQIPAEAAAVAKAAPALAAPAVAVPAVAVPAVAVPAAAVPATAVPVAAAKAAPAAAKGVPLLAKITTAGVAGLALVTVGVGVYWVYKVHQANEKWRTAVAELRSEVESRPHGSGRPAPPTASPAAPPTASLGPSLGLGLTVPVAGSRARPFAADLDTDDLRRTATP